MPHDPTIAAVSAEAFETPLHNPFVTSQGAAHAARAVSVRVRLRDGREGVGEAVPVTYVTGETIESVLEAVGRAAPRLAGCDAGRWRQGFAVVAEALPDAPSARCGLESALLDAWAQATGRGLLELFGGAQDSVESDITIPIAPNPGELAEMAWGLGLRVFKLKVGDADPEADHARVRAVRNAAPGARLRIDANQGFTPEAALRFVESLVAEGAQIELLEQPVKKEDYDGLAWVAARSPVPVFADEACRSPQHALRLADTPVQGINCKANKMGVAGVLDVIAVAKASGKKLMLGCMLETRRGIALSLALACGTGAFDLLDLDSHLLLDEPGPNPFFAQDGPRLTPYPAPRTG